MMTRKPSKVITDVFNDKNQTRDWRQRTVQAWSQFHTERPKTEYKDRHVGRRNSDSKINIHQKNGHGHQTTDQQTREPDFS